MKSEEMNSFSGEFLSFLGCSPERLYEKLRKTPEGVWIKGKRVSKENGKTVWKTVMFVRADENRRDFVFDMKDISGRYTLTAGELTNQLPDGLEKLA